MSEQRILYECVWCRRVFEKDKLSKVSETRCPYCGFNVIKKSKTGRTKLIETSKIDTESKGFIS
ncbi:MAG: DNA-directed RNA polymerase subunit P [Nitrososphaerota archaeon]